MRAVIQRVCEVAVVVEGREISRIGVGLLVLLGVAVEDGLDDAEWLCGKIVGLRIFDDAEGKMNRSLRDVGGDVMVVSQFTLHAATRKGSRPSFIRAAAADRAEFLYEAFCHRIRLETGRQPGRGMFGADMRVSLVNDGPVTIVIDSRARE